MAKGNSVRGRTSDASKPYDVSNSFVKRVASRVTELLPQPSWLSRWISPASIPDVNDFASHSLSSATASRFPATSRAELNILDHVDQHIPTKKLRTERYNSPVNRNKFLRSDVYDAEVISPIAVQGEPVAGPSSAHSEFVASTPDIRGQPQNSTKVNGDECSETSESTSGCSSLVPQAQSTARNLGGSRYGQTLPPGFNVDSLYRRRPSFSTTTFASPMRASMRERLGSSPFYSGRTMYGGSSQAYLSALYPPQRRVGPTVKPMPAQQSLPLSSTAKRILDALEQFSTPVMDAKRMPVVVGTKRKLDSGNQRYTELNLPSTPDLLRVKRRERLQQSTSAARQTVTACLPSPLSPTEYTIRMEDSDRRKHTGKVKTKENVSDEALVTVKLPAVVLSVDKLPKIDIAIPPPPSANIVDSSQSSTTTNSKFVFASPTVVPHSGSLVSPANIATTPSFKFSPPIGEISIKSSVRADSDRPVLSSSVSSLSRTTSDDVISHLQSCRNKEVNSVEPLDSNSVINILHNSADTSWKLPPSTISVTTKADIKMSDCKYCHTKMENPDIPCSSCYKMQMKASANDKLISMESQWLCPKCKNKKPSNSESCDCQMKKQSKSLDATKNNVKSPSTSGFASLYKKPIGTWECSTCMIRNKYEVSKCIACESAKPVEVQKDIVNTSPAVTAGFGDQFKKPTGSWECQVCMIINKPNTSSCSVCETPKAATKSSSPSKLETIKETKQPGSGFGSLCNKAPGSWTCHLCLIVNNAEKMRCEACETIKPDPKISEYKQIYPKVSFGIPTTVAASNSYVSTTFSFGVNKADQSSTAQNTSLFMPKTTLSTDSSQAPTVSQTFSFGIPKTTKTESDNTGGVTSSTSSKPLFQFGSTPTQTNVQQSKPSIGSTSTSKQNVSDNVNKVKSTIPGTGKEITSAESTKPECRIATGNVSMSVPTSSVSSTGVKSAIQTFLKEEKSTSEVTSNTAPLFKFGTNKATQNASDKLSVNAPSKLPTPSNFVFETKQADYGSSIASSTTSTISSSSPNVFKFGDTKTVSSGVDMSIPSVNTQTSYTMAKANNIFSFGSNTAKKNICFGATTNEIVSAGIGRISENENKPTFGSFGTTSSAPPAFGNTNAFGNNSFVSKEQQPSNPFVPQTSNVFGTTETTNASSTSTFSGFGQTNAFQTAAQENKPSAVFAFGSGTAPSKDPVGGFTFTPDPEKRTDTQTFGFSATQTNTSGPGFGFNIAPSAPATTFSFEAKTFGSGISPFTSNDASNPVFGTPSSQQPAIAFGEQANRNPVFAFGSQPAQSSQTPANPMFEFASNQQQNTPVAPAPSTTFVFGSIPATPAFDPNMKPTFNFTQGSTPVFSAIPTVNSTGNPQQPVRKIRKAVRRNPPSVRQT